MHGSPAPILSVPLESSNRAFGGPARMPGKLMDHLAADQETDIFTFKRGMIWSLGGYRVPNLLTWRNASRTPAEAEVSTPSEQNAKDVSQPKAHRQSLTAGRAFVTTFENRRGLVLTWVPLTMTRND